MTVYVRIKRLNGRMDFAKLAYDLHLKGFGDRAEYNEGGWQDNMVNLIASHIRFKEHDDALAYVLAYGGKIENKIPMMEPGIDFIPGG